MKGVRILLLLVVMISGSLSAASISLRDLDKMEDVALADRLQRTLIIQYQLIAACEKQSSLSAQFLWQTYPLLQSDLVESATDQERRDGIIKLISAIQQSRSVPVACLKAIPSQKVSSVRKLLLVPPSLNGDTLRFYKELSPACFPVASKGSFQEKENNACFAGDRMIMKDLEQQSLSVHADTLKFANELFLTANTAKSQDSIDLFNVYLKVARPDVKKMFTLLAAFSTSGNSGLTGWLQGVEDAALVKDLNDRALSATEVYSNFKFLQAAKMSYQVFRQISDEKKLKLTLFGNSFDKWNRHNVIAAYLGCREQGAEEQVVANVSRIGLGYESKDFIAHLRQGISWNSSVANFKQDTQRYRDGALLGYQACH
ncbi:hypothetical protein [Bdellovibrio sp. KM01]|uniref:hypothetical protein n=1 Tax=Bdellovibrio sp. KM01 TaxID=2748865 RepID=UPI0015E9B691|nr:hypothetical protein [Bdellovibrio sp. KM01]QLY24245.1 hypothetical protein HW988_12310 [Bdellovibrio sp. KM01]